MRYDLIDDLRAPRMRELAAACRRETEAMGGTPIENNLLDVIDVCLNLQTEAAGEILRLRAMTFAIITHEGQPRKYSDEPYRVHLKEVADTVARVGGTPEMIAAAWLHDSVEDHPDKVSHALIKKNFGETVAHYVYCLTDVDKSMGNRTMRKAMDRERLRLAPNEVKTIKLADLLSNTPSIEYRDPKFAKTYMPEKRELLPALVGGDATLHAEASAIVARYFDKVSA